MNRKYGVAVFVRNARVLIARGVCGYRSIENDTIYIEEKRRKNKKKDEEN